MSHELDKLNRWFRANKLSLNVSKTNFMIFSNKKCDDNYSVSINGMEITRVYVTKFLGVYMDSQLRRCLVPSPGCERRRDVRVASTHTT